MLLEGEMGVIVLYRNVSISNEYRPLQAQKRAQQARDDQAMNANLAMLPYANQEGGMSNANTNNFALQQLLLRNIYAGQQTTPTTVPSTGTIGGP